MKYRWQREITRSEYYYLINMISNRLENLTDDETFKFEDDKLEAQLEFQRERNKKQELFTGGF
jgi:hypothetical protein